MSKQKFVYELEAIQNLIRYTKHKLSKNAVALLDSEEVKMPSITDVNPRENQEMAEIKTVIRVQPQKVNSSVTKITGFGTPTEVDFEEILGKLPPLVYSECKEVELEEQESEEEKKLNDRLKNIPNGLEFTNTLVQMFEENFEEPENANNTSSSFHQQEDAIMHQEERKTESVKEPEPEVEPQQEKIAIDGYSQDELEDCVESDDEFNPKVEDKKPKITPLEVLKSREDILNNISQRNDARTTDKKAIIKEKITDKIDKEEWSRFKGWYKKEQQNAK